MAQSTKGRGASGGEGNATQNIRKVRNKIYFTDDAFLSRNHNKNFVL
jgi:hypothetical protein